MKALFRFLTLLVLLLSACTRSASAPVTLPEPSATAPPSDSSEVPTATLSEAPSSTEEPTTSPEPASPTPSPTESTPSETPTPSSTATMPPLDPASEYGSATLGDSFSSERYWADAQGNLPDTDFIKLALGSGEMLVTGKPPQFDTWWFTSTSASDYFIEMDVETDDCSGKQAYGLIVRGPSSVSSARGYILTFSCDGAYRLVRLDGLNPYTAIELVPWTESPSINAGADQSNTLGMRLIGGEISIYANQALLETFEDDRYGTGRFGLFVNAGAAGDFTYRIQKLSFWNLD